ncbi:MAG: hypothetical protein V4498_09590 [candidate division FCPU426 bacterium]
MRTTLACFCMLLSGVAGARNYSLAIGGGWSVPLSPRGPNSFESEHEQSFPSPDLRLMAHRNAWGLGIEAAGSRYWRHDSAGSVEHVSGALALEWDALNPEEEEGGDHLYGVLELGWGQTVVNAPQIARTWNGPDVLLALGYEFPLGSTFSILGEVGCRRLVGPSGYDPLAIGIGSLKVRSSF